MRAGFLCDNFASLHTRQDQNELHLKRSFKSITGPLSEAKTHWMVNWLQLLDQLHFVWRHIKVFMQNSSRIDIDGASRILSAIAAMFSLFLAFHALVY